MRFNEYKLDEFAPHVGSKTDLWVLSDYVCVKLLNKYPERRHPVLVAIAERTPQLDRPDQAKRAPLVGQAPQ